MSSGIAASFLGALQASLSVLLTIGVGVVLAQFGALSNDAAEELSHICVNLFLPCLLISNLGSELSLESIANYVPIIIWAAVYTIASLCIGHAVTAWFRLPNWTVPAVAFNNTESLPLLLLQALGTTGVLATLVGEGAESESIDRAKSYFLACSVITNTITFGQGPQILAQSSQDSSVVRFLQWVWYRGGLASLTGSPDHSDDEGSAPRSGGREQEQPDAAEAGHNSNSSSSSGEQDEEDGTNERTSLLPTAFVNGNRKIRKKVSSRLRQSYDALPAPLQKALSTIGPFFNPPALGACLGLIIGLVPALHSLFFSPMGQGGYFNAWLTSTIKNVGDLFVSLQVIVVGVKLSLSLRRMKEGGESGTVPLGTVIFAVLIRFVLWPAISISLIWGLAAHTSILPNDPILWFTMMLMPVGPSAMKLLALADVSGSSGKTRMAIAKFLTLSYIVTPLVSVAVVGALEASKNANSR